MDGNVEACAVQKNVKNLGATRAHNRKIQSMLGNRRDTGFAQVKFVDLVTNERHNCTTKQEVEMANISYLPDFFLCGDNTPVRSSPLLEVFSYTRDTAAGDEVTAGIYTPPSDTDEYTKNAQIHESPGSYS